MGGNARSQKRVTTGDDKSSKWEQMMAKCRSENTKDSSTGRLCQEEDLEMRVCAQLTAPARSNGLDYTASLAGSPVNKTKSRKRVTTAGNKSGKREKKIAASQSENTKGSPTGLPDHGEDIEINICEDSCGHNNSLDDTASSADESVSNARSQKRVTTAGN